MVRFTSFDLLYANPSPLPAANPKYLQFFVNRGCLTFDDVETIPVTFDIKEYKKERPTITLPPQKFQNVSSLVVRWYKSSSDCPPLS